MTSALTSQLRDRITLPAMVVAIVAFGLGLASLTGTYSTGIHWDLRDDRLVVDWVEPASQADADGVRPGMIAVAVNGQELIRLPQPVYADPDPQHPDDPPAVIRYDPPTPTTNPGMAEQALNAARFGIVDVQLIAPEALAAWLPDQWPVTGYYYPGASNFDENRLAILPGIAILLVGAWWLQTGRFGGALRDLAIPLAVATSVPLLVLPLASIGSFWAQAVAGLIAIAGMLPFAIGLARLVDDREERRIVGVGIAALATAAAVLVLGNAWRDTSDTPGLLRWALIGSIPLLPGLAAAGPMSLDRLRAGARLGAGGLLRSTELAVAGATPLFALGSDRAPYFWPLLGWLLAVFIAGRFTVRPLARLATRATLQRDLVVAATEAERARLAADIHDDALQELTLLVRRLEASGDTEGAEIGRTVADRLRAICGDLRLPILDDLGVGPALDWLVLRIERLAGGEVRLERADDARHSPDIELAIFRVAQEALANAVKHGKPPIVVRYRSTPGGISLAIDDAGPGIADEAPADAEKAGRFGLLNMAQRAEQIGAILDIKRWPSGGTHVALEWRPR
jgi:signal transduction histidine kinase